MNDEFTDLQKLLQLKRHETPDQHYFENFLEDFQRRQRSELLQRSARSLLFERIGTYFTGGAKPIFASGVAFATIAIGGISYFNGNGTSPSAKTTVSIDTTSEPISLWHYSDVQLSPNSQLVPVDFSPGSLQFERSRGNPRRERFLLPEGRQALPSENEKNREF